MMRITVSGEKAADIDLVDGRLVFIFAKDEHIKGFVESLRREPITDVIQTDAQLYRSLPSRLSGNYTRAGEVTS